MSEEREPGTAEVIPLPGAVWRKGANEVAARLDEIPVRNERLGAMCGHERSAVDGHARVVRCRDCGAQLDPIKVLTSIAGRREAEVYRCRQLRAERERLREHVEELERTERNAKARIRTARRGAWEMDGAAVRAAAESASWSVLHASAYRQWPELSEEQRRATVRYVAVIVEAYLGALEEARASA